MSKFTIDDIKARCVVTDDGHWIWKGALSDGRWPRIWAPDHTKPGSPMTTQTGRRAVWHVKTGQPIPDGHRVYGTCSRADCLCPEHMACGPTAEWGEHMASTGANRTMARRIASRLTGQKRSVLTLEQIEQIRASSQTGTALARELNVSKQTVSKARTGRLVCFDPIGGFGSGLGAR